MGETGCMLFTNGLKHSLLQCNTMKLTTMLLINATVAIVTYTNGMHPTGDVFTMGPSTSANCLKIKQVKQYIPWTSSIANHSTTSGSKVHPQTRGCK